MSAEQLPEDGELRLGSAVLQGQRVRAIGGDEPEVAWATSEPVPSAGRIWLELSELAVQTGLQPVLWSLVGSTFRSPHQAEQFEPPLGLAEIDGIDGGAVLAQLLTSTGQVAYIQLAGKTRAPASDLIRVMPGLFSPPLSDSSLAVLTGGETAFWSPGSFRAMATLRGFMARGNFQVPAHPDIDQKMQVGASVVPSPENLLRQIEGERRP